MVDCWELRAVALAAGVLLVVAKVSLALLALHCLLSHHLFLQWGPQGKGAVNDLMIEVLTAEASVCHCLGCCGI